MEKNNVYKTSWYKRENIGAILKQNQIDLVCILPIWPETFCYTVSEAQLAHIPVLATDIGALARIRQDKTGWLVSPTTSAGDILKKIDEIFADQKQFIQICEQTEAFRHKTISEMYKEYAELYRSFSVPKRQSVLWDSRIIYNAYVLGQADAESYGAASDADLIRRINELEATLRAINMSLEYRMVKFFNRENMPFKRQIKWMIGFAYRAYVKFLKK